MTVDEAFDARHKTDASGCWRWTANTTGKGYGRFYFGGQRAFTMAHRFSFERSRGPVPDGMQLDHLCRVRDCVNPAHLEAVTQRTNVLRGIGPTADNARKTHCKRGHAFTPENTRLRKDGWRTCRQCMRASNVMQKQRRRRAIRALKRAEPEGES